MSIHQVFAADSVRSLVWDGDTLVDWVGGGNRYGLDGSRVPRHVAYSYRFDAAVTSDDGAVVILFERFGTKGLVLQQGKVLREINRSFYHADDYEFPVCLWRGPEGQTLLAHCPDEYNRIEIEDAVTGERLTEGEHRNPSDFFHSRLQTNPSGTRLLSAGWVWHPWDAICYFELADAYADPKSLDSIGLHASGTRNVGLVEESSACWQTDDRILISGGSDEEDPEEAAELAGRMRLLPNGIAVYDIGSDSYSRSIALDSPAGIMMPVGEDHVLAFCGHPRLVSLADGSVVEQWPDLRTGNRISSIHVGGAGPQPPLALDPKNRRFAVHAEDGIHVISVA